MYKIVINLRRTKGDKVVSIAFFKPASLALNGFLKNIAMKKYFLLQIFYVFLIIALMSLLWEFVVEGFLSLDGHEDFSNKIEDVWATIVIACLALAYPTYKGLSIIRNWKELEKTLINQEMQSDDRLSV